MTEARKENRGPSAAAENRAALVAAARELLAEGGYDVPLSAIARRAGVGQGSLYRHFPDRISLALAVFTENIDALARAAERPAATLDDIFAAIADQAAVSSAFIDMLQGARSDPRVLELSGRVRGVLTRLLIEGQRSGELAAWIEPDDLVVAVSMLGTVIGDEDPSRRSDTARRARRLLAIAFRA